MPPGFGPTNCAVQVTWIQAAPQRESARLKVTDRLSVVSVRADGGEGTVALLQTGHPQLRVPLDGAGRSPVDLRCAPASRSSRLLASGPAALATPPHTLFQQPARVRSWRRRRKAA